MENIKILKINIQPINVKTALSFKRVFILLVLVLGVFTLKSQPNTPKDYRYYYGQGQQACSRNDYANCLSLFKTANELRPGHQIIMYQLAKAFALNDQLDSSSHFLTRALAIKADFNLKDSVFLAWQETPQFQRLHKLQQQLLQVVRKSVPQVILRERDLHIESVAYDPNAKRFYFGSVYQQKILWSQLNDTVIHNFTTTGQDDLWSVFGMKVDANKKQLWACSVTTENMINSDTAKIERSAIFKYDLKSGRLLKKYLLDDPQVSHWFGDLTINDHGDVYISDSRTNNIYSITEGADSLSLFLAGDSFLSLQGLDFDETQRYLFVSDYVLGPHKIDLTSKQVTAITCDNPDISLKAIDGLYYHQNSLVTTQNQVVPMRVAKYQLDKTGTKVIGVDYLEKGHDLLNEPTLGIIEGSDFYYVTNSQWGGYDKNHQPKPWQELQDIYIMKVGL